MENKGGEDFFFLVQVLVLVQFSISTVISSFCTLITSSRGANVQLPPQKKQKQNVSSVVQFNIFALSRSLSSVISSGQMGYLIPQALSQLDLVVPRGPQHNHSLSFPIPTVQEVTLLFPCIKITFAMHYLYM